MSMIPAPTAASALKCFNEFFSVSRLMEPAQGNVMTDEMSAKQDRRVADFRDGSVPLQLGNNSKFNGRDLAAQKQARDDPTANFRHFCKICKRRFACGRALGGHMRIHGTAEKSSSRLGPVVQGRFSGMAPEAERNGSFESVQDNQEAAPDSGSSERTNPLYALRANRKRSWLLADQSYTFLTPGDADRSALLSNSRACDVCGKEFSSWKALLAHIKCWHSNPVAGGCSASESQEEEEQISDTQSDTEILHSSKGMRAKRMRVSEAEEQEEPEPEPTTSVSQYNEEEDMANCLVMLAAAGKSGGSQGGSRKLQGKKTAESGGQDDREVSEGGTRHQSKKTSYKCRTCDKVFSSFQALGGHRASHKNLRGCTSKAEPAVTNESSEGEIVTTDEDLFKAEHNFTDQKCRVPEKLKEEESDETLFICTAAAAAKTRLHECSICHKIFPSGQALGGHKRCHWTSADGASSFLVQQKTGEEEGAKPHRGRGELFDLNLPPPADEGDDCDPNNLVKNFPMDSQIYCKSFLSYNGSRLFSGKEQTHAVVGPDDEAQSKQEGYG